jgi:amino acid efflux transporter
MTGRVGVLQGAALYIGAVLGTGVIALPALAAEAAGPASLVAWLGLVLLSVPLAATFAALGARYPDAGGVSTYVRLAFGPRAAAVVGWCFYSAIPVGAPAAAIFGGAYVAAALGGGQRTTMLTAAVLMLTVAAANAFGLSVSGRLQLVLAVLLVVLLLAAVVAAAPHARVANLRPFAPHGWLAVGSAAALLVWSFAGWEAITHLAADFRRPARDLPRAAGLAVVVVGVLYLSVAAASVLVLGPAAGSTHAPLAQLLALGVGGRVEMFAAAAAVLLTLGVMNVYFAGAAKLGAALGRGGVASDRRAAGLARPRQQRRRGTPAQSRARLRARRCRPRRRRADRYRAETVGTADHRLVRGGVRARHRRRGEAASPAQPGAVPRGGGAARRRRAAARLRVVPAVAARRHRRCAAVPAVPPPAAG